MAKDIFLCGRLAQLAGDVREAFAEATDLKAHSLPHLGQIAGTVKPAHRPLLVIHEEDRSEKRSAFAIIHSLRKEPRWLHVPILVLASVGPSEPRLEYASSLAVNARVAWIADPQKLIVMLRAIIAQEIEPPFEVKTTRRAELAIEDQKFSKAISLLYSVIEKAPGYAPAHAYLGEAWLRSGDSKKAREFYNSALHVNPGDVNAMWGLGKCASRDKNHAEAVALYEEAAQQDTLSLAQRNDLGDAYLSVFDTNSAKAAFESVLIHDPKDIDATVGLGKAAILDGDFELGAKLFERCRRPEQLATCLNEFGIAMSNLGKLDRAVDAYKRASGMLGESKKLHLLEYNIGLAFWRVDRPDDALAWFRTALEREPTYERARQAIERTLRGRKAKGA